MRVVAPYTHAGDGRVWDALDATGWSYDPIPVGGSDHAYFDTLAALWVDGDTFCVIEHDIQIHPTALDELADCEHDWCGFPYRYGSVITSGMGCVKFSEALIARHPDAFARVALMSDPEHPPKHWCRIDSWLQHGVLIHDGEPLRHEHEPMVTHLSPACSHGCFPT